MSSPNTNQIEKQLDELISRYQALKVENRQLRSSETALKAERSKLLEKNELATTKIEAMIGRLKSMESSNG